MDKEIVMVTRGGFCTDVVRTHRALQRWRLPYREINIRKDPEAQQRCLEWNHNLSKPSRFGSGLFDRRARKTGVTVFSGTARLPRSKKRVKAA